MDGTMDIPTQIRLMRSVVGRKYMEIDDFSDKAASLTGDEAGNYVEIIDFLKKDIMGYKTIIDDLKDGSCDYTGNLYDIASLPADTLGLYNDFYLPLLSEDDRADEDAAMQLKVGYAKDLAKTYLVRIGKQVLTNELALNLIMSNDDILAAVGAAATSDPEIMNALQ